ncbi:hemagglutinin/amebocyte aggregation factor-like isoform X2 [Scyliorhinus canicula]|uniref:hemagglutinin/amebocyte aggregation factor-like isoform X2 n=1 Tax=Scyliorhinus canicula TaxID=7830 RepID=UPI0018F545F2|nr:hemagglutinin/amebocyte aggregation factor-like isoform X2 [Scyliorhinus canicula]
MRTLGLLLIIIAGIHGGPPARTPNKIRDPARTPNEIRGPARTPSKIRDPARTPNKIRRPHNRWVNEYDDKLLFTCPTLTTIGLISSQHHSYYEDRLWDFKCKATFSELPTCAWTNYVNNMDEEFVFTCPFGSIITGVEACHSNYYEDRRWKFSCCRVPNTCNKDCFWTDYLNLFDDYFSWKVPDSAYLVGVSSYHNDYREDRRWKYQYCTQQKC